MGDGVQGVPSGVSIWATRVEHLSEILHMILMLTSTCIVYADDHLFYAMSSDMEIVKKMFTVSLMYGAQLCFALKKFKWENCLKLSKQN